MSQDIAVETLAFMCLHKRLCVYSSLIYFLLQTTWILLFYIMALQLPVVETYVM